MKIPRLSEQVREKSDSRLATGVVRHIASKSVIAVVNPGIGAAIDQIGALICIDYTAEVILSYEELTPPLKV